MGIAHRRDDQLPNPWFPPLALVHTGQSHSTNDAMANHRVRRVMDDGPVCLDSVEQPVMGNRPVISLQPREGSSTCIWPMQLCNALQCYLSRGLQKQDNQSQLSCAVYLYHMPCTIWPVPYDTVSDHLESLSTSVHKILTACRFNGQCSRLYG